MARWKKVVVWLGIGLLGVGLVSFPAQCGEAAREGLIQCGTVLIPSLFPFLVLSSLVIRLGLGAALGRRLSPLMVPLFRVGGGGAAALILGLVGGYPLGARTVRGLYDQGVCSREEAGRLLMFTNNCGPAFLLSTAGVAVLGSRRAGWLLWLGHCLGAVTLGILLRFLGKDPPAPASSQGEASCSPAAALLSAVTDSAQAAIQLSAFVVCFGVLLRLLAESGGLALVTRLLHLLLSPLGFSQGVCTTLVTGGLEVTKGIFALSGQSATPAVLALAAFLLGWGGLSVHCQTLAVLQGSGLPFGRYLLGKLCHGLLAAGITYLLATLFPQPTQVVTLSHAAGGSLSLLPAFSFAAWAGVALLLLWHRRKNRKNSGNLSSFPL